MSSCITCGKGISLTMKKLIEAYIKEGVERWFYRTSEKGDWLMVTPQRMNEIKKEFKTKKGYKIGFEFYNIKEYRGY